jgi:hypothetical protein
VSRTRSRSLAAGRVVGAYSFAVEHRGVLKLATLVGLGAIAHGWRVWLARLDLGAERYADRYPELLERHDYELERWLGVLKQRDSRSAYGDRSTRHWVRRWRDPSRPAKLIHPDRYRAYQWLHLARTMALAALVLTLFGWVALRLPLGWAGPLAVVVTLAGWLGDLVWRGRGVVLPTDAERKRQAGLRAAVGVMKRQLLPETSGSPFSGARIVSSAMDDHGWHIDVRLAPGTVLGSLSAAAEIIGTHYRASEGQMIVTRLKALGDYRIARTTRSPFAVTEWPGASGSTCTRPMDIGLLADRTPLGLPLNRHILIAGMTGAGKSGVLNCIIANLSQCEDAELWGVDMKAGLELRPWKAMLAKLATDQAEAEDVLDAAVDEMQRRLDVLGDDEERMWEPTPDAPRLFVIVDELAELNTKGGQLQTLARMGRAAAVTLIICTQYPDTNVVPSQLRHQIGVTIVLRVARKEHMACIIGQENADEWSTAGFDADCEGLLFARTSPKDRPRMARAFWVDDVAVRRAAKSAVCQTGRPRNNAKVPKERPAYGTPTAALTTGDQLPDDLQDILDVIDGPTSTGEIIDRMDDDAPSKATIKRRLADLETRGLITREGGGTATRWTR